MNGLISARSIRNYEIIFVNDASTDNSEALLTKEIQRDKRIKLINMSRNFGNSECVLAGMKQGTAGTTTTVTKRSIDPACNSIAMKSVTNCNTK